MAVVLGGGAAMGAFQVGIIDILARQGFHPDIIIGTSVGAINGAFWALNHERQDIGARLFDLWRRAERQVFLPGGRLQMLRSVLANRDHLFPADFVGRILAAHTSSTDRIETLPTPFACVVCDAISGERVVLRRGPLRDALLATTSIPALFPPVRVEDGLYVDGGVVANCDLEAAVELGFDQALAINLSGFQPSLPPISLTDALDRALGFSLRRQTELTLQAVAGRLDVAYVQPEISGVPRLGDFSQTNDMFQLGRRFGVHIWRRHLDAAGNVVPGRLARLPETDDDIDEELIDPADEIA
jgi:NTE family protein